MNVRSLKTVAVALSLVTVSAFAAPPDLMHPPDQIRRDPIPLRNWEVHFPIPDPLFGESISAMASVPSQDSRFITVTPCRVVDTRNPVGAFGGPGMTSGEVRTFNIPIGPCPGIPAAASAYSFNFTVTSPGSGGWITAWPSGQTQPFVSTLNYLAGETIANAGIIPAGTSGSINVYTVAGLHLIIDINGYFLEEPATLPSGQTLQGSFGIDFVAAGANNEGISTFSFSPRLASAPTTNLIISGGSSTMNCPGTAADPQAAPGHLCLYESLRINIGSQGASWRLALMPLALQTHGEPVCSFGLRQPEG